MDAADSETPHFPPDDLKVDFGKVAKSMTDPGFMARIREQKREDDERHEREMKERADRARADAIATFTVISRISRSMPRLPSTPKHRVGG